MKLKLGFWKFVPGNVRYIVIVTMLLVLLNFLARAIFLFYNFSQAQNLSFWELFISFAVGVRFDLAIIFLLNGILFAFLLLPLPLNTKPKTFLFANLLIVIINLPVIIINMVDVVYYGFAEKRITHELWTTKEDLVNINFKILAPYWYFFVVVILVVIGFWKLLRRISNKSLSNAPSNLAMKLAGKLSIPIIGILCIFIFIRGGVQSKSIRMEMAYKTPNFFADNLALNSAFTAIAATDFGVPEVVHYMPDEEAKKIARSKLKNTFDSDFSDDKYPLVRKAEFEGPENKYNVVFLIIESFNAEYCGTICGDKKNSLTPVMDTLIRHGRLYTNFYANAVRSVESLPSLLNSMPEVFLRPTVGSRYEHNNTWGLGNMLNARGYETAFFCGARNGTMGFDSYSEVCGLKDYFGMDDYPNKDRDYDGFWGLHDGPFLLWMLEKEKAYHKPFFNVFFSVSNHHPFVVPAKGYDDIHKMDAFDLKKTTVYTDRVIGDFLREASKQDWYKNTIFLITGDHTFHEKSEPNRPFIENFHVPLFIMGPGIEPGVDDRPANQINVLPTMIELLKLDTYHASSGLSLLKEKDRTFVIENLMGIGAYTDGDTCVTLNMGFPEPNIQPVYMRQNHGWIKIADNGGKIPQIARKAQDLLGLYQFFYGLRVENRVIGPEQMKYNPVSIDN